MSMKLAKRVVERFGLTKDQRDAALERGRDVIVMAGAGSGKTRTLVARYASLLGEGLDPRRVVAITFTEKAALEMRSRVRDALTQLIRDTQEESERQQWTDLSARMDSARIGTIHSLCAEILRAHPADAGIDPRFDVLDEGLTSALQAQVVQDTLDQFAQDQKFLPLFTILETRKLVDLMQFLLKHRLEASECFANAMDGLSIVRKYIIGALNDSAVAGPISELRSMSLVELKADKLDEMVGDLLALWKMAEDALAGGNAIECAQFLYQARREKMNLQKGKKNSVTKEIIHALRDQYDALLDPVVGGKEKDSQVDSTSEKRLSVINPIIKVAFEQLQQNYLLALDQRQALDFDGLEAGAAKLLTRDEVRYRWQKEFDALLVDEFQDTNVRQRYIVEALAGNEGRMFIVGDARQSIYRFRQADVTVFRGIRQRVQDSNGFVRNLDLSFRAHEPLLQVTEDLLKHVMGDREDPSRPYYVPFSHLEAYRKEAPENFHSPHIELILGAGDDVSSARPVMATALARRLAELKREKQIQSWDEVALLFRTSTTYAYYEDALEELGIPFVTVAGRGFYDRPEIRDVVNILHALVDPLDNLAMAGLLRSPAFGLTDAALYLLRKQGQDTISYWTALQGNPDFLDEINYELSKRTVEIMKQLLPQVNRIPVAALIKQLMDATDYRAILASSCWKTQFEP